MYRGIYVLYVCLCVWELDVQGNICLHLCLHVCIREQGGSCSISMFVYQCSPLSVQ